MKVVSVRLASVALCRGSALLAATACCGAAWAEPAEDKLLQPALEAGAEQVPQLDEAAPRSRVEIVRWNQQDGRAFGVALGASFDAPTADQPHPFVRPGIGLRWRSSIGDSRHLDIAAWRYFDAQRNARPAWRDDDVRLLTTRVEMQFSSSTTRLRPELGALGFQLSSDTKLSMKMRRGRPMFYYRSRF